MGVFPAAIGTSMRRASGRWLYGATLALGSLLGQAAFASSGGITGASIEPGCNTCHASSASETAITLAASSSTTIVEGLSRTFTVTVPRTSTTQRTGFNASLSNNTTATLTESSGVVQQIGNELTHTSPQGSAANADSVVFTFTVEGNEVASDTNVTLRACGQRVNNGGTVAGDGPYDCDTLSLLIDNNIAPVANAGPNQTVDDGTLVTLTSASSTDTEGTTMSRSWTRTGGTCASTPSLSSAFATSPTFTAPALASGSCTLIYTVTVTDNSGAGKSDTDTVTITVNNPPTAVGSATSNEAVSSPFYDTTSCTNSTATTVSLLSSSSTDAGGSVSSRTWTQLTGTPVSLANSGSNPISTAATFTAPAQAASTTGSYSFRVTVTDNLGGTDTADVALMIRDRRVGGASPVANAGGDQNVNEGASGSLAATATDTDGCAANITYAWVETSSTGSVLTNANTATPSFTAAGIASTLTTSLTATFRVTATDPSGLTGVDTVNVVINNGPNANAGADFSAVEGSTVNLAGTGSNDPGGAAISYLWTPPVGITLSPGNTSATPSFTAPTQAFNASTPLTFQLQVTDSGDLTASDSVVVTINDISVGDADPVANAGDDQNANEGALVTLPGSATDNGSIQGYAWAQTGGSPTVTLSSATAQSPTFTAPAIADNVTASIPLTFTLTVTDNVGRTDTDVVVINVNNGPTANAGTAQSVIEGALVTLTAAGSSDPGGGALTYAWVQTAGAPTVTLSNAGVVSPTFTAPAQAFDSSGTYTFRVTVTDAGGLTSQASVTITVNDSAVGGSNPAVNAGTDNTVNEGAAAALSGSATDADGGALAFAWTQIGAPAVSIINPSSANASFTAPTVATNTLLTFQLTVTDSTGRTGSDQVVVTVNNGPTANAGADQTVSEGAGVTLDGTGSTDVGGGIATYLWQQTGGTTVALSGAGTASPTFTAPSVTLDEQMLSLTFQVTVTDATGLQATDTMIVVVNDISVGNNAPTANAGTDRSVNENAPVALAGSGTDPEAGAITFSWLQTGGTSVTLSGANSATPSFTAPNITDTTVASVTLTFQVTVTDNVGRSDTNTVQVVVNNGPNANAGADQTVLEGASVSLSAAASSDPGAGALTYAWTQVGGPVVALASANTASPSLIAPAQAFDASTAYTFQVTVTDAGGLTSIDTVVITVNDIAIGNAPPVANAGADATVNESASGSLNAGGSTDPEGSALTFNWTQTSGTTVTLTGATTATPSFTAPNIAATNVASASLTFQVTVTDNVGRSTSDSVVVTVNNGPNANAGSPQTVVEGATVTLSGAGSNDNGGALAYSWSQTAGGAVTLTGASTVSPTFSAPAQAFDTSGTYTFRLTVTDAGGLTASSTVTITVDDIAIGNAAPSASAGTDQRVNEGAGVSLSGAGLDPESGALAFSWTQTAGTAVALAGGSSATPSFTAPTIADSTTPTVTLTFQLRVTDNVGRSSTDSISVVVNNGPTANAGTDQTVLDTAPSVTLNGSGSSDAGGGAISSAWTQLSGTVVTLSSTSAASPTFAPPDVATSETLTFRLTVIDADGATSIDTVDVIVRDPAFGNAPPTVDAGTSRTVNEGTVVALAGTAADLEGQPLTVAWTQTGGSPTVTLSGASTLEPTFTAPTIASTVTDSIMLTFTLTVTDDVGNMSTDTVTITVNNGPNASAGADDTVTEGDAVTLDGSASNDPGTGAISYAWTQVTGTAVIISGPTSVAPTFTAPAVSTIGGTDALVFQVTVTDAGGLTATDTVTISVNDIAVGNAPPTSSAGADQRVNEGANAMLAGSGVDPESGPVTLQWTQTGGTSVTLSDVASASPTFVAPTIASTSTASETLTFQLTVTDNVSRTAVDTVQIVVNNGPNANAGADRSVIEETSVTLAGSGSNDPGAGTITYSWVQLGGTGVTLSDATTAMPTFTAPTQPFDVSEPLTFRLTVQDTDGLQSVDTVVITVDDIAAANAAPTANAGADARVNEGTTLSLAGSGTDPENATLAFGWAQTAGAAVTLTGSNTATPSFTAPTVSDTTTATITLTFELTVTDDVGRTHSDSVTITVNNGPSANAGADQTTTESTPVSLNGAGSGDAGGGAITYLWTQTGGPSVMITGATTSTPSFTAPAVAGLDATAALSFNLTVTDTDGATSSDSVGITVNDRSVGNAPPSVNAGADQQVNEAASATLSATATDPESGALAFAWTQTGGTAVTLTGASSAMPTFTAPVIADNGVANSTLSFSVTVTDDVGRSATDTVQVTVNNAPVANAGTDARVLEGTAVTLDGGASVDPGAGVVSYTWTQVGGASVTLSGANTAILSITAPEVDFDTSATLTFQLSVTDASGATATDTAQVTVDDIAIGNAAPTALAGADQRVREGEAVTLTGSGTDPEDATLRFAWVQTGGTAVTLSDASAPAPAFSAPTIADDAIASIPLTFNLTVTDDVGRTHTDSVVVTVDNGPRANAGADQVVREAGPVTLAGGGSADAGGTGVLSYQWTRTSGPLVTLDDPSLAAPTFSAPNLEFDTSAAITFNLTVTDSLGQSSSDSVTITVNDSALGNQPPVVNAGADRRLNEGTMATLAGGATDPDNDTFVFAWVQVSGTPVTLSGANAATPSFTTPLNASQTQADEVLVFALTVTDSVGRSATDQVTITVNNGPLADAGGDVVTKENLPVTLDGSLSADPGAGSITYAWTQSGGEHPVTLSGANTARPSFTAPTIEVLGTSDTLAFTLTVSDADGLVSTDTVMVQVDDIAIGNDAPTAMAGADQRINEGVATSLEGSATDPENGTVTFAWVQTSGTPVTLSDASSATPSFTADLLPPEAAGDVLEFTLTVTDDVGRTSTDVVQVVVNNGPNADPGMDFDADEGGLVVLDGRNSGDSDGEIVNFTWEQVPTSGPTVAIADANTERASFTAPDVVAGGVTLTFRLTVTDDGPSGGLTDTATVTVRIRNVNSPPVAVGPGLSSANENALVTLDGGGSSDPDGSALTYLWQQWSGPSVVLTNDRTAAVSFIAPEVSPEGEQVTLLLTVTDADGETSNAQVNVNILNVNRAPVADAGPDQTIGEGVLARLSGTNSTDDDGVLTYAWEQTGGTDVTLSDTRAVSPTFTTPRVPVGGEALTFALRVTDQEGLATEDTVIVNVSDVNTPPVAAAGADATFAESVLVNLDGTNSADADAPQGAIVSYLWRQTAGPEVALVNANTSIARFRTPLVTPAGTSLTFELTVTDDAGAMATDTLVVNVTNVNQPPVANAGADQSVREALLVTLDGSNSLDVDAPVSTYRWRQSGGAPVTLSDPAAAQPTFRAPLVSANTALTFELTVTDDGGLTGTDAVVVNVIDVGGVAPIANAGADQDVTEASNVLLDGAASTDADGSVASFRWRQTSGPTATLSDPNIAAPSFTAPLVSAAGGALVFELTVIDDSGLTGTDTMIVNVGNLGAIPVANAGTDQVAQEGATVTLDGSGSSDTGGSIVTFTWAQLSGPAVTLSNAASQRPTFVAPAIPLAQSGTEVVLQLTVTDDDGTMASDSVRVRINDNGISGFPDTVVTIRTTSNDNVGVQAGTGNLVMLQAVDPDSIADQRNRPTRLDFDLISTQVRVPTAGATVEVTYFLAAAAPAGATWVKYVPSQGWIDFGANARFSADRRQVTITLTDGGLGDDDGVANGIIVDPAGLGSFARDTGTPGAGNGGFASSDSGGGGRFGCSLGRDDGGVDASLVLLGLLALMYLGKRRVGRAAP